MSIDWYEVFIRGVFELQATGSFQVALGVAFSNAWLTATWPTVSKRRGALAVRSEKRTFSVASGFDRR
jgi:hypothetical protein